MTEGGDLIGQKRKKQTNQQQPAGKKKNLKLST